MSQTYVLSTTNPNWRDVKARAVAYIEKISQLAENVAIRIGPYSDARTVEQNAAQWPILTAFSEQLMWPVNGEMVYMTPEEWKDVLTAAFKRENPRLAMGLDGGVVMLGQRTSKFKKKQFSEWLEFLHATAAHRGVDLNEERRVAA